MIIHTTAISRTTLTVETSILIQSQNKYLRKILGVVFKKIEKRLPQFTQQLFSI